MVRHVLAMALVAGALRDPCTGVESPSGGLNSPCTRTTDCEDGLTCDAGVCVEADGGRDAGGSHHRTNDASHDR